MLSSLIQLQCEKDYICSRAESSSALVIFQHQLIWKMGGKKINVNFYWKELVQRHFQKMLFSCDKAFYNMLLDIRWEMHLFGFGIWKRKVALLLCLPSYNLLMCSCNGLKPMSYGSHLQYWYESPSKVTELFKKHRLVIPTNCKILSSSCKIIKKKKKTIKKHRTQELRVAPVSR